MNSPQHEHPSLNRFLRAQNPLGRWWLGVTSRWRRHRWSIRTRIHGVMKGALDVAVSAAAVLLLSPLLLLIALLVKLDGGPVFFRQKRVGFRGREFGMLKFRSMVANAEALQKELMKHNEKASGVTFKMKNDPRVTRIGRILRKTSLDELPQLLNILRGEMSLVGPRPALPREVAMYSAEDRFRLLGKPGLTCLWQVGEREGRLFEIGDRNAIDFPEQVALDVRYIEERSFLRDVWLILKTLPAIILGKGA